MTESIRRLRRGSVVTAAAASLALAGLAAPAVATAHARGGQHRSGPVVTRTNLVSDQPGHARITDPNLVNAWGMSHGADTPLWVSDNGADVSSVYTKTGGPATITAVGLVVKIPGGAPTGQVFNDTKRFVVPGTMSPALFVFAGEDGQLSAWNQQVNPMTSAVLIRTTAGAVYKGLALVHTRSGPRLLAANFRAGRVDVFTGAFRRLTGTRMFRDSHLPRGYAPFNVAVIAGHVFVTYAKQDRAKHDDVSGAGHGFVDQYTKGGAFQRRLVSRGALNSPWGMVTAPRTFGRFAGSLLVGNFGDGRIHAYSMRSGRELGTLRNARGRAIVIDGLWGLIAGNSATGGPNTVWFSAGPNGEKHGLLGTLTAR